MSLAIDDFELPNSEVPVEECLLLEEREACDEFGFRKAHPKGGRYEIQRLAARHREMIRLSMLGLTYREIAQIVNCTKESVSACLNSTLAVEHMNRLQADRDVRFKEEQQRLQRIVPDAIAAYEEVLNPDNEQVSFMDRFKAAGDLLDRVGHGKVHQVQGNFNHSVLTFEDIKDIKDMAAKAEAERAQERPMVEELEITATPIEEESNE